MTLIAAMDCGDSLLVASDGLVTLAPDDTRVRKPKLWMREDPPLAFGFTGSEGVGFQFRDWLASCSISENATWPDFAKQANEQLSRLNGTRISMAKLAGATQITSGDLATFLLAGYLDGRRDIWELTFNGEATSIRDLGLAGVGKGYTYAFAAYKALTEWAGKPNDLETMAICMGVAAEHAPMCGKPIQLCRITTDGLVELRQDDQGKWNEPD